MNEHHKRVAERILAEIQKCKSGKLRLEDLEDSIESHLQSLDTTFPNELREQLDKFVVTIFQTQTQYLDEPNEDAEVQKVFEGIIELVKKFLK